MNDIEDSIEKTIRLASPRSRVWQALADSREFGEWFGVEIKGPWEIGKPARGRFLMTFCQETVDEWLDEMGLPSAPIAEEMPEVFCEVEAIDPEERFIFRWIPYPIDAGIDPASEPRTRVEFLLRDDGDGTLLRVTESGFSQVPLARRRRAFMMNTDGWGAQLQNIARHLQKPSAV